MESSGVNVSSSDVPTEGWWFEQTHPSRKSSKRKAKPCPPPNHVDIANLASMLEEHGDSALPSIKLAVQGDPSVLNRMGLYEQVETSGQRSFTGICYLSSGIPVHCCARCTLVAILVFLPVDIHNVLANTGQRSTLLI